MRILQSLLSATVVLAVLGLRTVASAQTPAPGPYYALPAWDQTLDAKTRFTILSNFASAAVLDRETGLVWEKQPASGKMYWQDALNHCNGLAIGNRMGWRLPSLQELASLFDAGSKSIPTGSPFTVSVGYYWSATRWTSPVTTTEKYAVYRLFNFANGDATKTYAGAAAQNGSGGINAILAWCVRGGSSTDFE